MARGRIQKREDRKFLVSSKGHKNSNFNSEDLNAADFLNKRNRRLFEPFLTELFSHKNRRIEYTLKGLSSLRAYFQLATYRKTQRCFIFSFNQKSAPQRRCQLIPALCIFCKYFHFFRNFYSKIFFTQQKNRAKDVKGGVIFKTELELRKVFD